MSKSLVYVTLNYIGQSNRDTAILARGPRDRILAHTKGHMQKSGSLIIHPETCIFTDRGV